MIISISIPGILLSLNVILNFIYRADAIKCYQCSTEKDGKDSDSCGAYKAFNHSEHIAIDCMGEESMTPGTFCFKSIQQGPRGFIWDGRWRSVIRRCAQVSKRGVSWSCDWGYNENGVYFEECYCAEDNCNGVTVNYSPLKQYALIMLIIFILFGIF